jgi:hypothetical protein
MMDRDDLQLGDSVYIPDGTPDAPSVARIKVSGLGRRIWFNAPTAANGKAWIEADLDKIHPTRAEAWAAVIEEADLAVSIAMRRLELAQAAAAAAAGNPETD